MRLAFIVSEFPKFTETFILRDLVEFHRLGHEIRLYHLRRFRKGEVIHDFARPVLAWARGLPYLMSRAVLGAVLRAVLRRPDFLLRTLGAILWSFRSDPVRLAKSLLLLPKSLAFAEELLAWQPHQVHAEFAGHPATSAWIIGGYSGLPWSVSCRAHDIFISQALLATKLRQATHIRTISEFNRQFLGERVAGLSERAIRVIHSSVDTATIPPLGPPSGDEFHVLYVGSHHVRKGIDILLEALRRADPELGQWRGTIVGDGPERRRLERLANRLGLANRLTFSGRLPYQEVARAYCDANVLVAPSIIGPDGSTEGIPNVCIEALAHQRPVISTAISGIPELIVDGETGFLVAPGDAIQLAAAIVRIRRDPERAFAMACRGRAHVEEHFDLRRNARRQLELLERFAARYPG